MRRIRVRIINGRRSPGRCRVLAVCKVKLPFSTKFYLPSRMASPIYLCGKYGSEVGDEQDGVQCESECQSWFYATCANIDHDEYERLSTSDVFWECQTCRGSLPALNSVDAVDILYIASYIGLSPTLTGTSSVPSLMASIQS